MLHPLAVPGDLTLQDVALGGAWLATSDDGPYRVIGRAPGSPEERDLSWLNTSAEPRISHDGSTIVFTDASGSAGSNYSVCLRKMDGSAGGAGMVTVLSIAVADDPRAYACHAQEYSSRLFQLEGVK